RRHRVDTVDALPRATPEIAGAARELRDRPAGRIDLVQPADGRVRVIDRPDAGPRHGDSARETIVERVGGREFRVDAGGFWQVHRLAAHTLTEAVKRIMQKKHPDGAIPHSGGVFLDPDAGHLDLYGGVALFAVTLGDLAGPAARITTVESDRRATAHAEANLTGFTRARAETGRVDRWLARRTAQATAFERDRLRHGVIVLDPPRAGAGRDVVEQIVALGPASIVYVACDPVALARDLGAFRALGYQTRSVDAYDLFPNSHHVEAVALLEPEQR
ncbi:MAG: class I SAM-dependent RNA methyltransferase, partial [Microbacterium sp.]|uniref:class I SAM-dependent RNA methyltransferase n=1 Tax=Microbacterium sp. TaxID=51671 RepID=UPI003A8AD818